MPFVFQDESSVQSLIDACIQDEDKLYLCVSSPTIKDKPVQIRPWRLSDADFVLDASLPLDPRKTVFVGGVPRPLKAGKFKCRHNYLIYLNTEWFNAGVFAITLTKDKLEDMDNWTYHSTIFDFWAYDWWPTLPT